MAERAQVHGGLDVGIAQTIQPQGHQITPPLGPEAQTVEPYGGIIHPGPACIEVEHHLERRTYFRTVALAMAWHGRSQDEQQEQGTHHRMAWMKREEPLRSFNTDTVS